MQKVPVRIAIVDDDASIRQALSRLLETTFDISTFESAEEFIAALAHNVPECIVLDLQMPRMTGLQLQHYLASSGIKIPTIITTANAEPGARERCIAAGASAYLVKPLRKATLISAIRAATEP
jgi:FixJ family two-component response regulator